MTCAKLGLDNIRGGGYIGIVEVMIMLPAGLIVSGYFLGSEYTQDRDGKPQNIVGVATGISSMRVYMKSTVFIEGRSFGDEVMIHCRAYAGKNGIVFVDGEFIDA